MNNRIAEIRKHFGLTQAEFGAKIGLSRDGVASYERGNAKPTGVALQCIVSVFRINKHWLETGEGEMLDDVPDPLEELCRQRGLSPLACGIVKDFVELNADQREAFLAIARRLFASGEAAARSAQSAALNSELGMSERPNPVPVPENPDSRTAN